MLINKLLPCNDGRGLGIGMWFFFEQSSFIYGMRIAFLTHLFLCNIFIDRDRVRERRGGREGSAVSGKQKQKQCDPNNNDIREL